MLGALGVTSALGFSAFKQALDQGGVNQAGRERKRTDEMSFAPAQTRVEVCLSWYIQLIY